MPPPGTDLYTAQPMIVPVTTRDDLPRVVTPDAATTGPPRVPHGSSTAAAPRVESIPPDERPEERLRRVGGR